LLVEAELKFDPKLLTSSKLQPDEMNEFLAFPMGVTLMYWS